MIRDLLIKFVVINIVLTFFSVELCWWYNGALALNGSKLLFVCVLQQQRSAEMQEMHQRTRDAVDSIVQHYQVVTCFTSVISK